MSPHPLPVSWWYLPAWGKTKAQPTYAYPTACRCTPTPPRTLPARSDEVVTAKVFIDGSYDGDVMVAAGDVDYTAGREAVSQYNES